MSSGWLETLYAHAAAGEREEAVDLIIDQIDDLLCAGEVFEVDRILDAVDLSRLDSYMMVAFLSATLAARKFLCARRRLVVRIEEALEELCPDRKEGMLSGLR